MLRFTIVAGSLLWTGKKLSEKFEQEHFPDHAINMCKKTCAVSDGFKVCTRILGHEGKHVATGATRIVRHIW